MDILYLIAYAGKAGTEKYVAERMEAYSSAGDTCRLAYDTAGPLSENCRRLGFPTYRLDMRPHRALSAARELAAYCREQGVEIIHAQYPRENVIALLARRFYPSLRVFFTSHLTIRQGRLWRMVNRFMTPGNEAVIAVCAQGAELLRQNGVCPERIGVIYNGVEPCCAAVRQDRIREEYAIPRETTVFLTMARYAPEKGLDFLLDSLSRLRTMTAKPFCCAIAGDGEEYERITERIAALGLNSEVIQLGYREDAQALLSSADVYVSTALYNEAMSYAILEAMGAALPLAVTDVGAGAELARRCGLVAAPGDVEAMAENLRILLEDEPLRASYGRTARERCASEFSLTGSLGRLHALYESPLV